MTPAPAPTGPKVVALGGGHGLSASLAAARLYAGTITAIVSVADDGGSSGRLREALDIPAPGDLRKSLVALAEPGSIWARAFDHRFDAGELQGHPLGNLVIAGLLGATGDITIALDHAARVLNAAGRVLPATTSPVVLKADGETGPIEGQVKVQEAGRISQVGLVPPDAEPPPAALEAILGADQVLIGPGSLYTSVLAVAVVPAINQALRDTRAQRVYVANLRPQIPETAGYTLDDHLAALARHHVEVDAVLHDPEGLALPDRSGHDPVQLAAALRRLIG